MTHYLDADKALELLERAVEEKGADYVYEDRDEYDRCRYTDSEDQPSCIVGYVVKYLSDELGDSSIYENLIQIKDWGYIPSAAGLRFKNLVIDPRASWVLGAAQAEQDDGQPWGSALRQAKTRASED